MLSLLSELPNVDDEKLDIEGLNITVTSGAGKAAAKPKGKARAEGLEILANANLKLKAGVHYALIGRNGTGKSSELCPRLCHQSRSATSNTGLWIVSKTSRNGS
jgi:ABC-type dipeptide/oligopeptide/nickel transport system ATPase subunit